MAGKPVPLVNLDNHKKFIDYISKRVPKFTLAKVTEMIALANDGRKETFQSQDDFLNMHDVFYHQPETHNDEQKKIAENIEHKAFALVNNYVDSVPGLRVSFRNALNQERHKNKLKYTNSAKSVMELNHQDKRVLVSIRDLCKKLDVDFNEKLNGLKSELERDLVK